jgi:hypothetical protein
MSISKTVFKLNTGAEIPALGLGMDPLTNPTITPPFLQFLQFSLRHSGVKEKS